MSVCITFLNRKTIKALTIQFHENLKAFIFRYIMLGECIFAMNISFLKFIHTNIMEEESPGGCHSNMFLFVHFGLI